MQIVRRCALFGSSSRNQEESGNQPAPFTACRHLQKVEAPLINTHVGPRVQTTFGCMSRTSSLSSSGIPREDESIVYQGKRQEPWPRPKNIRPGDSQPICRPVGALGRQDQQLPCSPQPLYSCSSLVPSWWRVPGWPSGPACWLVGTTLAPPLATDSASVVGSTNTWRQWWHSSNYVLIYLKLRLRLNISKVPRYQKDCKF